nr:sigma-70 family RNA polymerase sigma factor [Desulfoscipio gibsoniae]
MMIIAAMEGEDNKAFMLNLYRDYYGLVRKTVYNITHDADNVEDLINDTFIKLIEKISLIRTLESCRLAAYVVYTSKSVAINYIKHKSVQRKHAYYGGDTDLTEKVPDLEDTIEERIIHHEEMEEMGNAILRLPEKQKDLLYFKYILGMADAEIAETFGIAPGSVRQYLTRARKEAQKLMDKEMSTRAE